MLSELNKQIKFRLSCFKNYNSHLPIIFLPIISIKFVVYIQIFCFNTEYTKNIIQY